MREQVYFQNMVYPITWLVLVASLVIIELQFNSMFYAYFLAQFLTVSILFLGAYRDRSPQGWGPR